ncbi:hypothetical protein RchiOBHm_Chr6g0293031 [Rosa chinensis]|uniref:Uncharacterized protein n=1 Tax=Rosa chinensis TaxID=74649 RepID=A0A2P6PWJ8_ROSCH|nr:hypothetical protein RchiOBHm_Chr6g0293031 [Rosa chinensis]
MEAGEEWSRWRWVRMMGLLTVDSQWMGMAVNSRERKELSCFVAQAFFGNERFLIKGKAHNRSP